MNKVFLILFAGVLTLLPLTARENSNNAFNWSAQVSELKNRRWKIRVECCIAEKSYLASEAVRVQVKFDSGNIQTIKAPPAVSGKDGDLIYPAGICRWVMFAQSMPSEIIVDYQGCVGEMCLMPETITVWKKGKSTSSDPSNLPSLAEKTPSSSSSAPSNPPSLADDMPSKLASVLSKFTFRGKFSGVPENAAELAKFLNTPTSPAAGGIGSSDNGSTPAMGFWAILLLVFLGGLGLNLTPCVLPMIPVNLAIIGADAGTAGKFRGFRRGAAYGLGITLAYGVLGVLAALTGSRFGELNSSSVFNFVIAAIFLLLALGMFGVYELDLSRLGNLFQRKNSAKPARKLPPEISAFGLGIAAALLAGACVAPVVITIILLAARLYSEGNMWGLTLPFALGLSMALPWPLLGAGMSFLPQPGMWMVRVKQLFGVVILLMALYYAYLGWTLRSGAFDQTRAVNDLAAQLEKAAANGETVLIDCWASWCKNCKELDKLLESGPGKSALAQAEVKLLRFRAEKLNDPAVRAFMDKFQLPGLPSMILLQGKKP